jgi:hypothetical protein
MQLQVARCQSILKLGPEGFCFSLAPAVYQSIIGIPAPGKVGVRPRYPEIKRVMHEQIRQNRTDHSLNAKGNFRFERTIVDWRSGFVLDLRRKE